ncbi:MAG: hypothetical protein GX606_03495, partial [Elusimicrobia bacterium]|nr:hypothetical protein [Elusimicrobiota bacterium]
MIKGLTQWRLFKGIAIAVLVAFVSTIPASSGYAQSLLPAPGEKVGVSAPFVPTALQGIHVDPADPFRLSFIMYNGEEAFSVSEREAEYQKLIRYFMAALVVPNEDMWVNLSPREAEGIIPSNFSRTEMGRDLLAQDYLLKQFTASLIYPEDDLGKAFWKRIYRKAYDQYGTTDIPVDTFNKVWIMADRADIYQKGASAVLVDAHLKVMLEQDLLAREALLPGGSAGEGPASGKISTDIVREVIIPVIEQEINEGRNFAAVRQAYQAMILATWFKKTLREHLLSQVYTDRNKLSGIALDDAGDKDRIYEQYLAAYRRGVFNYIKEEFDEISGETLPRKYFSGGMTPVDAEAINTDVTAFQAARGLRPILPGLAVTEVALQTTDGNGFVPDRGTAASPAEDRREEEMSLRADKVAYLQR